MTFDRTTLEEFPEFMFSAHPLPLLLWDAETTYYVDVNDAALALYGYTIEEWRAMRTADLRPPEERERFETWRRERQTTPRASFPTTGVWKHLKRDGTVLEVEIAQSRAFRHRGRSVFMAVIFDVTERNRVFALNRANGALLDTLDNISGVGTFHLDLRTGRYRLPPLWIEALGRRTLEKAETTDVLRPLMPPEHHPALDRFIQAIEAGQPFLEQYQIRLGGELRWLETRASCVTDDDGTPTDVVGVTTDVTEQRRYTERLYELAFRDTETGLPNRAALQEKRDVPSEAGSVVLFRARWVAPVSQRSPQARAAAAKALAAALKTQLTCEAIVARYAVDVYALVLPAAARPRSALALSKRLVGAFERPLKVRGDELVVVPSIGIASASGEARDLGELCREAECALDMALRGEDPIAVYDDRLAAAQERRAAIDRHLRHAIHERRISALFQPIVSLETGHVVGAEALMRWNCPDIGPVPPTEFIAVAEDSGIILNLGEWMLREACAQLRRWHLAGHPTLRIAVNVSARQVQQRNFVRLVASVCELTSIPAFCLEFELTESTMMQRDGLALRNLEALRRLGVRISVDDFGTGYSSLSYLKQIPLDTLKIDRSFVAPLADDEFQADVARSVVTLAQRRGLGVVAEGVETIEQVAALREMGCDEAQGFLFGRPMTAADMLLLLQRDRVGAMLAAETDDVQALVH